MEHTFQVTSIPLDITKRKVAVPDKDVTLYYIRVRGKIVATLSHRKRKNSEEYGYWLTWAKPTVREVFGEHVFADRLKNNYPRGNYAGKNWTIEELIQQLQEII